LLTRVWPLLDPKIDSFVPEDQGEDPQPGKPARQRPAKQQADRNPKQNTDENMQRIVADRQRVLDEKLALVPRRHCGAERLPKIVQHGFGSIYPMTR
jgi:hypothetical protein